MRKTNARRGRESGTEGCVVVGAEVTRSVEALRGLEP